MRRIPGFLVRTGTIGENHRMKVLITGTPLESLGWQRELGKVRIVFRPNTSRQDQFEFLDQLERSCDKMRTELLKECLG